MTDEPEAVTSGMSTGSLITAVAVASAVLLGITGFVLSPLVFSGATPAVPSPSVSSTATPASSATPSATAKPVSVQPAALPALTKPLSIRFLFAHQSVGASITAVVPEVYKKAKLAQPKVGWWDEVMNTKTPVFAHVPIGTNGDPEGKLADFVRYLDEAPAGGLDMALLKLGYADINASTDVDTLFEEYATTMADLQAKHPDIVLLYSTVPLVVDRGSQLVAAAKVTGVSDPTWPAASDNIARERFNTLVRAKYRASGKLYDVAALEARAAGGKLTAMQYEGQWYPVLNPELAAPDRQHLNDTGALQLATELVKLVSSVPQAK